MLPIAQAELRMLWRNKVVAACAILMPLAFAVLLIVMRDRFGGEGGTIAALQIIVMAGFGVYITATTTLAARRQTLLLKRLRSTAITDGAILGGLLLPVITLNVVQLLIVLTAVVATGDFPANGWLVALHVAVVELMFLALALATWGLTSTPEQAQITTMPVFILALGTAMWITLTGSGSQLAVQRALPGGASVEAIVGAWSGTVPGIQGLLLTLPTLAWALAGLLAAMRLFRWEPRH
ncbi:ABC transporter permease [Microbacterium lacticum]